MLATRLILTAIAAANCASVSCFWVPPYAISLHQKESFVFLSDFAEGAEEEEEELEMMKDDQLSGLEVGDGKMKMLDEHLRQSIAADPVVNVTGEKGDYLFYTNNNDYTDQFGTILSKRGLEPPGAAPATTRLLINGKEKRTSPNATVNGTKEADYDYDALKTEYDESVRVAARNNNTFNYTDGDDVPERGFKDGLKYLLNFKRPRNCTREEAKHFGIKAVNCIVHDYGEAKTGKQRVAVLRKLWRITRIWLVLYIVPVTILYCKFGWCCCCCCCCDLCSPRAVIHKAKRYAALNPPGVLVNSDGTFHTYQPTEYETEAYEYLMQYVRSI